MDLRIKVDRCQEYYQQQQVQGHSEEDGMSVNSMAPSTVNSELELPGPVSVREMVRRYNTAVKGHISVAQLSMPSSARKMGAIHHSPSQHVLPSTKSSYCGVNRYGSQTNVSQHLKHTPELDLRSSQLLSKRRSMDRNSLASLDCVYGATSKTRSSEYCNCQCHYTTPLSQDEVVPDGLYCSQTDKLGNISPPEEEVHDLRRVTSSFQKIMPEQKRGENEVDTNPGESTYQSKTTISKTTTGVRITIDIFFDHDQPNMNHVDVIGSRIETEIPESRILREFQEKAVNDMA